jgi:FkbM family methyltransferase
VRLRKLKKKLSKLLLRAGYPVPDFLVRERDRPLFETLRRVRPGMVVLDVGAHRGETAAAFAARGARVYAFEPNPDIFPDLVEQARRHPSISCENCGILDVDGEMKLYLHSSYQADSPKHSESSSLLAEKPDVSTDDFRIVPVRDVADVVAGIDGRIDIAKIDAEGAEYRIVRRLIESGAIDRIGEVRVEPHHDRIPGLQAEFDVVAGLIAERGLGERIRFDWM